MTFIIILAALFALEFVVENRKEIFTKETAGHVVAVGAIAFACYLLFIRPFLVA